jgi:peptidoglycan glycosyltransferase
MGFEHQINRLLIGLLIGLAGIGIAATYWAIVGADTILLRDDNPRRVEAEARLLRGAIQARDGTVLAESAPDSAGVALRRYASPSMNSALGYFSLRYGVGGAEAAYDRLLRGDDRTQGWGAFVSEGLLHRARRGSDIRLTFDPTIQDELHRLMAGYRGGGIVMGAPSGEVLALLSLPTIDPNTLDANWDALTQDADNPFFNRALQGDYQPGGLLQTPLLAAALLSGIELDKQTMEATRPVVVSNVELGCLLQPRSADLTLGEAFLYGCPAPFEALATTLGADPIEAIFRDFRLDNPPILPGFLPPAETEPTPLRLRFDTLIPTSLGQGDVTITPLEAAVITAALTQGGSSPYPITLVGTRQPDSDDWQPQANLEPAIPMMTSEVAGALRNLFIQSVDTGAARAAGQDDLVIGGQVALAYAGDETQSWFIGFTSGADGQSIITAVVIENTADVELVARIGGEILAFATSRQSA